MDFDLEKAWDSVKEGTKEIAEAAHVKTKEFHKNYVSKVIPDCGKYGDTARFVAEMAPGVSEYNAIVEGDWTEFAIAAGIDVGALVIGACTAGAGYAAIKGGSVAAKTGTKIAVKEVAEVGTKKAVKEMAGEGGEKVAKEVVEAGAQKAVKEVAEEGAEKTIKEVAEESVEKSARRTTEKVEKGISEQRDVLISEKEDLGVEINQQQKVELVDKGMSLGILGDCKYKDGVYYLKTIYNKYEGRVLDNTDVEYLRKTIDFFGTKIEGVFPKFKSVFEAQLPIEKFTSTDRVQFVECTTQLKRSVEETPSLAKKFTPRQLEQIAYGKTPEGYVWHHNEEVGKMQLVKSEVHDIAKHTGGRAIWGGGSQAR